MTPQFKGFGLTNDLFFFCEKEFSLPPSLSDPIDHSAGNRRKGERKLLPTQREIVQNPENLKLLSSLHKTWCTPSKVVSFYTAQLSSTIHMFSCVEYSLPTLTSSLISPSLYLFIAMRVITRLLLTPHHTHTIRQH